MRADLAGFFGRPIGGLPVSLDFIQAMHLSHTSQDFAGDREAIKLHLNQVTQMSKNLDQAQVRVGHADAHLRRGRP
ncbi:hypothetical protein MHW47_06050 [Streptomyces sp. OfavH-34-F]|uniref:hypothetical protein n=1 Tax=Streptomyces sp. OfavH-34-F TaxID=2917760 RepID=UPI001EF3AABB|nr:hypothetical protein [Streptomyces sp. OfavH-34-F]MCG7524004.1 hypothetical protein [Streptomyces sp. OfavH-34-F]